MPTISSSGGMSEMAPWLDRKYANQEEETAVRAADVASKSGLYGAQANLAQAQADLGVPSEAGLRSSQAYLNRAQADIGVPSEAGLRKSQAGLASQQARGVGLSNQFGELIGSQLPAIRSQLNENPGLITDMMFGVGGMRRFNRGSAKVMNMKGGQTRVTDESGNGHPRVDTVPAMLAEGEAVLNAGAAELMGRENIRDLNKRGLRDMKMDDSLQPVMKKGGRLGPFSGVAQGHARGTNFARTPPNNDAEYHPTEYREPRDPEHDAEHMAQPLSSGGQGYGLRCGTAKVMKYADGTSDAGGHGTPSSPSEVNAAGTRGGSGRNVGARFAGVRGYADGAPYIPGNTPTELANFERQRQRNQTDEALPDGIPVAHEAAGAAAAVTPSRETARLRQNLGLAAQGFAYGTSDVQAPQQEQDDDVVYAAEGDENILRRGMGMARDYGARAMEGLRGFVPSAAAAAPTSASEAATAGLDEFAAKRAAAAQAARMGMGEMPDVAAQAFRAAPAAVPAAAGDASLAYRLGQSAGSGARSLRNLAVKSGVTAAPIVGGALSAGQAVSEMPGEFFNDPNVSTADKATQALRSFGRAALPYVGGAVGSGVAPVAGTLAGTGLGIGAASLIEPKGEALRKWEADRFVNADSQKSYHDLTKGPVQPKAAEAQQPRLTLRGLATMGALMGHQGAASVLRDLTENETTAMTALSKTQKLPEAQIFDPPRIDEKTGMTVPGAERKDQSAQFNDQYMPMYARQWQAANPGGKLTPAQLQAEALTSFNLNRAAQEYALRTPEGKAFAFKRPILPQKTEFVRDLPSIQNLIGRERGENYWREGIFDKGGLVVTDGVQKQVLPVEFLESSGFANDPDLNLMLRSLKGAAAK